MGTPKIIKEKITLLGLFQNKNIWLERGWLVEGGKVLTLFICLKLLKRNLNEHTSKTTEKKLHYSWSKVLFNKNA